jgi:hypothetical protein
VEHAKIRDWLTRLDAARYEFRRAAEIAGEIQQSNQPTIAHFAATRCVAACSDALTIRPTDYQFALARDAIASLKVALQEMIYEADPPT